MVRKRSQFMEIEKNLAGQFVLPSMACRPGRLGQQVLGPMGPIVFWVAIACWSGCQSASLNNSSLATSGVVRPIEGSVPAAKAESAKVELAASTSDPRTVPGLQPPTTADAQISEKPISEQEAMAGVLEKLQEIGSKDPAAQQYLLTELRATEPRYWSVMVERFQSTMAFRQQLAARDAKPSGSLAAQAPPEQATTGEATAGEGNTAVSTDASPGPAGILARSGSQVVLLDSPAADPAQPNSKRPNSKRIEVGERKPDPAAVVHQSKRTAPANPGVRAVSYHPDKAVQQGEHATVKSGPQNPAAETAAWDRVIGLMEESASEVPDSMDDIHQQMRLRMLYLAAGRQEDALRPISGASPVQQDYWSEQLFALATFLDNKTQPDSKRRAAAALLHLDEARDTLAQMATLNVRNLTFVASVDGYGSYKPAKRTQYKPGQQVTLYAEVENFHSETTEQGYRISLGTSYQVVDENGRRVDGGQFPDVLDQCKNHRRDFHIQYGIPLPTRIYPGSYQLQLIVTDNQTGKIGQASLPFEIADEHK